MKQVRLEALRMVTAKGLVGDEAIAMADEYANFIVSGKKVLQLEPKNVTKKRKTLTL